MPQDSIGIVTYLAGLGVAFLGTLGIHNVRQTSTLRKDMVSDGLCGERRETYQTNMEAKIDGVKENVEGQRAELIDHGKILAGMDVNIAQLLKNSTRKRGDD